MLPVEVEIDRLCAVLQAAGLLGNNDDDKQAVIAAFERAVDLWLTAEERKFGSWSRHTLCQRSPSRGDYFVTVLADQIL